MGLPPSKRPTDVFTAFPTDQGPPATSYAILLSEPPQGHFVGGDVYAAYGPETVKGTADVQHYTMTRSFTLRPRSSSVGGSSQGTYGLPGHRPRPALRHRGRRPAPESPQGEYGPLAVTGTLDLVLRHVPLP